MRALLRRLALLTLLALSSPALADEPVRVFAHKPMVHPIAVEGARPETQAFLRFIGVLPVATAIFDRHGFTRLKR